MLEPKHNSPFYKADGKDYLHMPPAVINAYIKDVITPHLDIAVEFVPTMQSPLTVNLSSLVISMVFLCNDNMFLCPLNGISIFILI